MNIRLVAYRPPNTTATTDNAYELDLQEAPNISLNFQFSDIKEPEKRKGSYSQTFKIPFTENNNAFFENWYEVNLETLVFSTTKKFTAVIFVGATPQFDGVLKLKGVYKKAKQYEVVIMANSADLFTEIGDKKVVDAVGTELDHTYNHANIKLSWDGTTDTFLNSSSVSLQDADAGVQKVMYPLTVSEVDTFYFSEAATNGTGSHLNMNQTTLNAISEDAEAQSRITNVEQLKPAVQIKAILKLIIANAGFSYTSDFIDGSYFGKLFMTTCNALDSVVPPITNNFSLPGGDFEAESDEGYGFDAYDGAVVVPANEWIDVAGFSSDSDLQGFLQSDGQTFEKVSPSQTMLVFQSPRFRSVRASLPPEAGGRIIPVVNGVPDYGSPIIDTSYEPINWYDTGAPTVTAFAGFWIYFFIDNIEVGQQFRFQVCVTEDVIADSGVSGSFFFGGDYTPGWKVTSEWMPYSNPALGNTISVKSCIDSNITQKAFLKDILERFNMVIITDPSDPTNLLIEPYTNYLEDGSIKDWTEKLDVSKEIVVKDTTSLQKRVINLSDLEDVDLLNKITADFYPTQNVWGKYYEINTTNEFSTGELKNNPVFAPFRVEAVYKDSSGSLNPQGPNNLVVHYVFSTENTPDGVVDVLKNTQPKLFYYRGTPTDIRTANNTSAVSIFMHNINYTTVPATRTAYEFTQYPVCTVWDINTSGSTHDYTLSSSNKSLFWGFAPPDAPDVEIFNFNGSNQNSIWELNTLYGLYWSSYLNATYSSEARLMECHLNLNEVDIYNFKFNDEIFIKDTYWRILNIHNYEVGSNVSTKVVLLKAIDNIGDVGIGPVNLGADCSYTLGSSSGSNIWQGYYLFCPEDNPGCTPSISVAPWAGTFAEPECCENLPNAEVDETLNYTQVWSSYPAVDGLKVCKYIQGNEPNPSALPVTSQNNTALSMLSSGGLTSYFQARLSKNFVKGSANMKFNKLMIPQTADDLCIKYVSRFNNMPQVSGESHKLILLGTTTNIETTTSYIQGNSNNMSIPIPAQSNMMLEVMGISTIVSSSNATYGVGHTEQFVYYTAFRNVDETVTQIGTALGRGVVTNIESGSANSFLEITSADDTITGGKKLQINVKSTADNTTKVFTLDVNMTLQRINSFNYDTNWALWQNGQRIQLQNNEFLVWN